MTTITPFLWFDHNAEDAARFYAATFPDSTVDHVHRSTVETPGAAEGAVLMVEFTVLGLRCAGLNGGPAFPSTEAFSFQVVTDDQAETDRYWQAITADGEERPCGWCKDRFGMFWQITPRVLLDAIADPDRAAARRAMEAMMTMHRIDIVAIEAARSGNQEALS